MCWSPPQITLLHIVKTRLHWDRAKYELLLRNVAGIRPDADGKVSSKYPHATNTGFERILSFAEAQGFEDAQHGPGYWTQKARLECAREKDRIRRLVAFGLQNSLFRAADPLPGFVENHTLRREGGPTRELAECDPTETYHIHEALKAFILRAGKTKAISREELRHV